MYLKRVFQSRIDCEDKMKQRGDKNAFRNITIFK